MGHVMDLKQKHIYPSNIQCTCVVCTQNILREVTAKDKVTINRIVGVLILGEYQWLSAREMHQSCS